MKLVFRLTYLPVRITSALHFDLPEVVVPYGNISRLEFRVIFDNSRAELRGSKWMVVTPVTLRHSQATLSTNYLVYASHSS